MRAAAACSGVEVVRGRVRRLIETDLAAARDAHPDQASEARVGHRTGELGALRGQVGDGLIDVVAQQEELVVTTRRGLAGGVDAQLGRRELEDEPATVRRRRSACRARRGRTPAQRLGRRRRGSRVRRRSCRVASGEAEQALHQRSVIRHRDGRREDADTAATRPRPGSARPTAPARARPGASDRRRSPWRCPTRADRESC